MLKISIRQSCYRTKYKMFCFDGSYTTSSFVRQNVDDAYTIMEIFWKFYCYSCAQHFFYIPARNFYWTAE